MPTYKKYIVFAWDSYSATGGVNDIEYEADTLEEAKQWCSITPYLLIAIHGRSFMKNKNKEFKGILYYQEKQLIKELLVYIIACILAVAIVIIDHL